MDTCSRRCERERSYADAAAPSATWHLQVGDDGEMERVTLLSVSDSVRTRA